MEIVRFNGFDLKEPEEATVNDGLQALAEKHIDGECESDVNGQNVSVLQYCVFLFSHVSLDVGCTILISGLC